MCVRICIINGKKNNKKYLVTLIFINTVFLFYLQEMQLFFMISEENQNCLTSIYGRNIVNHLFKIIPNG